MRDPKDKAAEAVNRLLDGFSKQWSRLWVPAAFLVIMIISARSCTTIEPGQVAVRINNVTGSQETLTQPGLALSLPFGIHSIYILDSSPQTFNMKGKKNRDALHVKELTVRASDGSNFRFDDTSVIFKVRRAEAQKLIRDSGTGGSFKAWLRPFARAVLRDEFGRESTISVSNPASSSEPTERALARLNELLNPHGIDITEIVTPKPSFAEEYENLIEARNEAENQLTVIKSELARSATERERRLSEVDRDQNRSIQERRAELEKELATTISLQAQATRAVDTMRIEKLGQGQAALSASVRQAEELRGQLAAEYQSRKAAIDAFRNQPVERVMERLGERLEGITIDIQPWSEDATPSRIQLEQ